MACISNDPEESNVPENAEQNGEEAAKGKTVAMICSGDAGVYGMSGLMLEIGSRYPEIPVEMVAGVTAAMGGAAVLGAPLIHDFALISLSDLLTPWEKIEKRLRCAADADFVICLYNSFDLLLFSSDILPFSSVFHYYSFVLSALSLQLFPSSEPFRDGGDARRF